MTALGARIRDLRTAKGITQKELAEPGYSRGFLAAVEAGHRVPSDDALSYLSEKLGVDSEDLRHGRPAGAAEALTEDISQARQRLSQGDDAAAATIAEQTRAKAQAYALEDLMCQAFLVEGDVMLHRHGPDAALPVYLNALEHQPEGVTE